MSELTFSSEENYMYHYSYPMKDLSVLGHPLSDYRLVIPAEAGITELRFANYYRNYLGQMTGVNLQIVSDTELEADCEIRIGATSRTGSTVERYEYAVTVTGDSVEILADSLYGYEAAYVYAQNQLLSDLRKAEPDCGELVSVDAYPAHKVYTVRGTEEYLIPAVPEVFIRSVDLDANRMEVRILEGMRSDEH